MAAKLYIVVKPIVKGVDPKLKLSNSGLESAIKKAVTAVVDASSTLSTKDKGDKGFILNATLSSLKADDAAAPTALDAKVEIAAMATGADTKIVKANAGGKFEDINPKKLQAQAEQLVGDIFDSLMGDVVPKLKL